MLFDTTDVKSYTILAAMVRLPCRSFFFFFDDDERKKISIHLNNNEALI